MHVLVNPFVNIFVNTFVGVIHRGENQFKSMGYKHFSFCKVRDSDIKVRDSDIKVRKNA